MSTRFDHGSFYLGYISRVAWDLKKRRPEVVHLHNFSQFAPVVRYFNPGAKVILHMHCEWLTQIPRRIVEPRLSSVHSLVGCSRYVADTIRQGFPERASSCHAILNGVDVTRFQPQAEQKFEDSNRPPTILFVGRVSPEKGVHVLIEAFSRILREHPLARLEIIGGMGAAPKEFIVDRNPDPLVAAIEGLFSGDYVEKVKASLGARAASNTTFHGEVSYLELKKWYQTADILVVPSVWNEPFGLPAVEAMACGLPVIAARSGGLPEIVDHGVTGLVVERGDPQALADGMATLLADPGRRREMGRAGRDRVERLFAWELVAEQVSLLYSRQLQSAELPAGSR